MLTDKPTQCSVLRARAYVRAFVYICVCLMPELDHLSYVKMCVCVCVCVVCMYVYVCVCV